MPTSTKRSGKRRRKQSVPVPSGMAAVMATIFLSFSARAQSVEPKTSV